MRVLWALAAAYDPATIRKELLVGIGRNLIMIAGGCYLYIKAKKATPETGGPYQACATPWPHSRYPPDAS